MQYSVEGPAVLRNERDERQKIQVQTLPIQGEFKSLGIVAPQGQRLRACCEQWLTSDEHKVRCCVRICLALLLEIADAQ